MDIILNKLKRARYISTIDLSNAYHQIELEEKSKELTSFTVPGKASGNSNDSHSAFLYLDDIVLVTNTFEEHINLLRRVLLKIRDAGLTINRDKSKFCVNEVKYLGFIINEHGLAIDPEKTEAIRIYPTPRTVSQVQRFNGMASWLRRFIKDYATIASPLTDITKNPTGKFNWGKKEDDAFNLIKQKIADAPMLHRLVPGEPFIIHADACNTGLGSMLTQCIDGVEKIIHYGSEKLKPAQKNYNTTEKECLAVKRAIDKFRPM